MFFIAPARAQTMLSAGELLEACTRPDMHWVDFCNGYFQAANDQAAIQHLACVKQGTTRTELVELFETRVGVLIQQRPALADEFGMSVAIAILSEAYPCT
jgi:Rap1a immunity proteins